MLKTTTVLSITLGFLVFSPVIKAIHPLYRILNTDEIKAYTEDPDVLVLVQLKDEQEGKFLAQVIKTITGKVNSKRLPHQTPNNLFPISAKAISNTPSHKRSGCRETSKPTPLLC